MGASGSKSSTDSKTSTETNYTDRRTVAGDGAMVATEGSSLSAVSTSYLGKYAGMTGGMTSEISQSGMFNLNGGGTINAQIYSLDAEFGKAAVNAASSASAASSQASAYASVNAANAMRQVAGDALTATAGVANNALITSAGVANNAINSATGIAQTALIGSADLVKTISGDYAAGQSALLSYSDAVIRQTGESFAAAKAGESAQLTKTIGDSLETGLVVAGIAAVAVAAIYIFKSSKK